MRPHHALHLLWTILSVTSFSLGLQQRQQRLQVPTNLLDVKKLRRDILAGRVYQQYNFLNEDEVRTVLEEIQEMEIYGKFQRKGLSNTVLKNQTFDKTLDRSICPVPWFLDSLEGKDTRDIPCRIRQLQLTLSQVLNLPTMADTSLNHECYYSKSEVGSRLPRHMDERHEEIKGAKGWLLPSRRSLSWLIYLSEPMEWDLEQNGGALRSYPQREAIPAGATHHGNLQVGWLVSDISNRPSRPVYLDSWFPVVGVVAQDAVPEPHCILYTLDSRGNREELTRPWLTEQLGGMPFNEFLKRCAEHDAAVPLGGQPLLFKNRANAGQFSPLEDRTAWDEGQDPQGSEAVDIIPQRGSLVVFDSVKLPHQVQMLHKGTRLALAGWFHERTQEFPDTFANII